MKQLHNVTLLAFLLLSISGFSQDSDTTNEDNPLSKGTIFLSGQSDFRAGLNELDDSTTNNSSYSISPTVGYFLINNLLVGAEVNFSGSKITRRTEFFNPTLDFISISDSESRGRGVLLAPFVRYYFNTGKIKPYISAGLGFGFTRGKSEITTIVNGVSNMSESGGKGRSRRYTFSGGTAIFLTKYVSVDTGIQYNNSTLHGESDNGGGFESTNSNINFIGGISIYL